MNCTCLLAVAGVTLSIQIDHPLIKNKEFESFFVKDASPDICASFQATGHLPAIPKQVLFSDAHYRIAVDPGGNYQRFFFEKAADPNHYAVATYDLAHGRILVEYLKEYERCVSEVRNCFFHLGIESILLRRSKLCLHAACVDTPFGGILFSGVSGIGKSTQAELWCQYRGARQINGDRPILSREGNRWTAWGSPYAGSSQCHVNDFCGVSAIVLLKQAKACSLRRLSAAEAFRKVWAGMTIHSWDKEYVETASLLTMELIGAVPVFELSCTPDQQAVVCLEQALRKEIHL